MSAKHEEVFSWVYTWICHVHICHVIEPRAASPLMHRCRRVRAVDISSFFRRALLLRCVSRVFCPQIVFTVHRSSPRSAAGVRYNRTLIPATFTNGVIHSTELYSPPDTRLIQVCPTCSPDGVHTLVARYAVSQRGKKSQPCASCHLLPRPPPAPRSQKHSRIFYTHTSVHLACPDSDEGVEQMTEAHGCDFFLRWETGLPYFVPVSDMYLWSPAVVIQVVQSLHSHEGAEDVSTILVSQNYRHHHQLNRECSWGMN